MRPPDLADQGDDIHAIKRLLGLTKANQISAAMDWIAEAIGANVGFRRGLSAPMLDELRRATTAGRMEKANLN